MEICMNHEAKSGFNIEFKAFEHVSLLQRLLHLVLQDEPLETILEKSLDQLLSISWLALLPKMGIFLVDEAGASLKLVAERNLGPQITSLCAQVKFGHCLCGRAALQARTQHANCVDERHETRFDGIAPHGHYNVPIIAERVVLGVLVVYLPHGHARDEEEVAFLESFADVMALLISAKQRDAAFRSTQQMLHDALSKSSSLMDTIQQHTIFSQCSSDGTITEVNDAFCEMSGYAREELVGSAHKLISSGVHSSEYWDEFWTTISSGKAWRGEICNRTKSGELFWFDSIVMPFTNKNGDIERYISIRTDITKRKQAEGDLARVGRILDNSLNEIYVFKADTLKFIQLNRGARENLGYTTEEIVNLTPFDIKPEFTKASFMAAIQPLLKRETDMLAFETVHERKDKSRYPVAVNLHYAAKESPPVFVAIIQDITERKASEARIEKLAFYDPLTGLANRALMVDRLRHAVARAERQSHNVTLLFLDLNRFKEINDTRGHSVGDKVLAQVARRFSSVVRNSETIARIGGDEFVVLLENIDRNQTERLIERLKAALKRPFSVEGRSHHLGVSIGAATYPDDTSNADALLQLADIAMYEAKANNGGYRFYSEEMGRVMGRKLELADRLTNAHRENRLKLYYQPIIELKSGALIGAEALLRWHEPDWGWIGPDEFIPVAEERRMMFGIGTWVVEEACRQFAEWRDQGYLSLERLAVNVAAQQLEGNALVEGVQAALSRYAIAPHVLEVEITESSMMKDPDRAAEVLRSLKDRGIRLSVDDFGTGYSSLAYLKQFDTDKLKIDKSFVHDLMEDTNSEAIVSATISMAHGLGLTVLAEGVETEAQAQKLAQMACDQAQGYLYSKPIPPAEFAEHWLSIKSGAQQGKSYIANSG
jgi:diguanylate cyclase (GGDEF)-like protein/PAS domain S-box-containing protein